MNLIFFFVVIVAVRSLLFQTFFIPSGSMMPAVLPGDTLVVTKADYGYSRFSFPFNLGFWHGRFPPGMPRRGDVVVFEGPQDDGVSYIKRVVGLPGDQVQMVDGVLYVNGQAAAMRDEGVYTEVTPDGVVLAEKFLERLPGGASEVVLKSSDDGDANNTPVYTVPAGHLFVLGDNRDDSLDSRWADIGFVPVENVEGRAALVLYSMDETPGAGRPRWNRILRLVS